MKKKFLFGKEMSESFSERQKNFYYWKKKTTFSLQKKLVHGTWATTPTTRKETYIAFLWKNAANQPQKLFPKIGQFLILKFSKTKFCQLKYFPDFILLPKHIQVFIQLLDFFLACISKFQSVDPNFPSHNPLRNSPLHHLLCWG